MNPPPPLYTTSTREALTGRLRYLLAERLNFEPDEDMDMIATGVLDSLALVDLVLAVEEAFGISVDFGALEVDTFRTLRSVALFVEGRLFTEKPC